MATSRNQNLLARRNLRIIGCLGALILLVGRAWAFHRQSALFGVSLDSISAGNGKSASASLREADCSLGQESVCGSGASRSFVDNAGIVQPWHWQPSETLNWNDYY